MDRVLEGLLRRALAAADEASRVSLIDEVGGVLGMREAEGAISRQERLEIGREWIRSYVRDRLGGDLDPRFLEFLDRGEGVGRPN
jgi:hypothetical protein